MAAYETLKKLFYPLRVKILKPLIIGRFFYRLGELSTVSFWIFNRIHHFQIEKCVISWPFKEQKY